ncbi:hypothetical protein F5I97DRAFT_2060907 [Phlebopus sp. FC_14]|nr:hypothetical protein F5I97DRAFT_2060907 [Phlebopus sp. FC_14]
MFTVKATYRNETRKFTFPEGILFPTYEELTQQLCRVFPLSHSFYLLKLIFSPDASKPGRILIGKEVHSAEEYSQRVAPLHRSWPNPRLRFTVLERIHHKVTIVDQRGGNSGPPMCQGLSSTSNVCGLPAPNRHSLIPPPPPLPISKPASPPIRILPPPPPPILFPASGLSFPHMECGAAKETSGGPPPSFASPPLKRPSVSCCSIAKGKADIESLLAAFQEDFNRIIRVTFGPDQAEKESASSNNPVTSTAAVDTSVPCPAAPNGTHQPHKKGASDTSQQCFVCRTNFTGIWYGCVKCPWHAVCPACFSESRTAHTLSFGPSHVVEQRSSPASLRPSGLRSGEHRLDSVVSNSSQAAKTTEVPVHRGVICDSCDRTITGIRHKCLDCPDYDLCTSCIQSGAFAKHNPFHEFFDIEKPGCVYVHTVFSGGNTRPRTTGDSAAQTRAAPSGEGTALGELPICHPATCNLCDSAIVGERFKCISCPDFDTCSSCFVITSEQHPNHGFVKLNRAEDLMIRSSLPQCQVAHLAACNCELIGSSTGVAHSMRSILAACGETIRGARYKCMHPSCADFDLCSNCEALPIPVHPLTHPMLKLKTVDTVIPTVYRVGQTSLIDRLGSIDLRDSGDCVKLGSPIHPNLPLIRQQSCTQIPASISYPVSSSCAKPLDESDWLCNSAKGQSSSNAEDTSKSSVDIAHPHGTPFVLVNEEMKAAQVRDTEDRSLDSVEKEGLEAGNASISRQSPLATLVTLPGPRINGRDSSPSVLGDESLATALNDYRTSSPESTSLTETHLASLPLINEQLAMESLSISDEQTPKGSLSAAFVTDTTIPDGQVFPPGAEFVKAWHMVNDGDRPWPPTTELQFVAGEMFMSDSSSDFKVKIGYVDQGEELDVWTGDLKAPDVPGRYVGYWRLNDGQGSFFGSSIWIDLTVADQQSSDEENENLLAASSMVMPSPNPTTISGRMNDFTIATEPDSPSSTKPGSDTTEDSDGSSVSLISVPSWDDDDAEWQQDTTRTEPLEYVVVYDSNSE